MLTTDLLTVGAVAERSGFATSALRYYERLGLISSTRTAGGQRRYERNVLRRLAFIRAARNVGLSLDEAAAAMATLPGGRAPTKADWTRLSGTWQARLDAQIEGLADDLLPALIAKLGASEAPRAVILEMHRSPRSCSRCWPA